MKEKDRVRQVFSQNSEAYRNSSTHANKHDLMNMIKWIAPDTNMHALDIATGGGHVAEYLSPYVAQITATDLTREMLQTAENHLQEYQNITFTVADAEALPFPTNSFDIVTCRIAAHHFPNPEAFLAEVNRVLTIDGQLLLIDNVAPEDKRLDEFYNTLEQKRDTSHVRAHTVSEWSQMFTKSQLRISREHTRKKVLPFREWAERILDTESEIEDVERSIMEADDEMQTYFHVNISNDHVESFAVDEWMVIGKRKKK